MNPTELKTTFTHAIESTGKDETFAKIGVDDIFLDILPALVADKRAKKVRNLRDAGASAENVFAELEAFDEEHEDLTLADLVAMTDKQPGKIRVVQYAYNKANAGSTARLSLNAVELFDVLNKLLAPLNIEYRLTAAEPETPPETAATTEAKPGQGYGSDGGAADPQSPQGYQQ
jgi:hypothetical protein